MHKGPVKQVHTKTGVLQGDRVTVSPEEHHVVDTHLGSPEKRGVLVEQKSEVVVVPVFRVRDQVHAIVVVKGLEAGEQRDFTSGRKLCPCQACLSGQISRLPRYCSSSALRLCPCVRRRSGVS